MELVLIATALAVAWLGGYLMGLHDRSDQPPPE